MGPQLLCAPQEAQRCSARCVHRRRPRVDFQREKALTSVRRAGSQPPRARGPPHGCLLDGQAHRRSGRAAGTEVCKVRRASGLLTPQFRHAQTVWEDGRKMKAETCAPKPAHRPFQKRLQSTSGTQWPPCRSEGGLTAGKDSYGPGVLALEPLGASLRSVPWPP